MRATLGLRGHKARRPERKNMSKRNRRSKCEEIQKRLEEMDNQWLLAGNPGKDNPGYYQWNDAVIRNTARWNTAGFDTGTWIEIPTTEMPPLDEEQLSFWEGPEAAA
jgi:hypothetical protein